MLDVAMSNDTKPSVAHSHPVDDEFNWSLEADWLPVEKKIGSFLVAVSSDCLPCRYSLIELGKSAFAQIDKWAADQKHTLKEMGVQHHQSIKMMEESKVDIEREIEEEREKERVMLKGASGTTSI